MGVYQDKERLKEYYNKSFTNQTPSKEQCIRIENVRKEFKKLMEFIIDNGEHTSNLVIATRYLEKSLMYAVKNIVMEETDEKDV